MFKRFASFKVTLLAVIVLCVMIGGKEVLGQTPPTAEERLKEKIEVFRNPPTPDPTKAAEGAAKGARYLQEMQAQQGAYATWLEAFKQSGVDPRSLEQGEMDALTSAGPDTIDQAVREAKAIVSGVAIQADFRATPSRPQTIVRFRIDEVLMGEIGNTVELVFSGGPFPGMGNVSDYTAASIGYLPVNPLLLSGDQAVLLLKERQNDPNAYIGLAWTGVNKVQDGVIKANLAEDEDIDSLDHSVLRKEFAGRTKAEIMDMLRAAITRNPK